MATIILQPSSGGGPGYTPTNTRLAYAVSAGVLGDHAGLTYDSGNRLTLGSGSGGALKGNDKLILESTGANIELNPGSNNVDLTVGQFLVPNGSAGTPSIAGRSDTNTGFYFDPAGADGVAVSTGGLLNWYCDTFAFFFNGSRVRPLSTDVTSMGEDDTRFTYANARHVMANSRTVTADTTLDRTYQVVIVNSATGKTITLPSAVAARVSCGNSAVYIIKNIGAGTVTVAATAGTVEAAATSILTGQSFTYVSDGTNWYVI